MTTDFFLKKYFKSILIGILTLIFICVFAYAKIVSQKVRISIGKNFYFLVSKSTHIQASTHFVSWHCGSGYLLEADNREYVVFSVYLQKTDALGVQKLLEEETKLIQCSVECIYVPNKKNSKQIEGAFQTYYSWLTVLEQEISRLAQGCTQQSCKQVINIIRQQMNYASRNYENSFSRYANVCKSGAEQLTKMISETVYVKDLRYLLCELCVAYCDLEEFFSI